MYLVLKNAHVLLATLAISGFLLRGYWLVTGSALLANRASKTLPHIVDAVFLISGVWLVLSLSINPLQHPWLLAKFAGLLAYIGFGMVAFRFGRTAAARVIAFAAAVASFAYIVGAAINKSSFSWLAQIPGY
jgi:uncharacterized membrane protein SirB2